MKKFVAAALVMILCAGLLGGCKKKTYDAEQSTVFILKKGGIISIDVENFDVNTYDKAGLEKYVRKYIGSYTSKNGADTVKLDSLSVDGGKAKLTLSYQTPKDYTGFNEIELFNGTMAEALVAGYSFNDVRFAEIKKGAVVGEANAAAFKGNDKYKIAVIKANTRVSVDGTIVYVSSDNVTLESKNTVVIKPGESLLGTEVPAGSEAKPTPSETAPAESAGTTESTENATEALSGSVGDDELDLGTEETEIVFDFPEDTTQEEAPGTTVSEVYTYIVYK